MNLIHSRLRALLLGTLIALGPGGVRAEEGKRVVVPPQLVHFEQAPFPPSEIAAGKSSSVLLQIAIDATGKVVDVSVQQTGGPAFDAAALAATKLFVFTPATVNGKPIPVKLSFKYDFAWKQELVKTKKATSDFVGLVRQRGNKKPLANIGVSLEIGTTAVTDKNGHFEMKDIQPGNHTVTLSGEQITTVTTDETFVASEQLDATYETEIKEEGSDDAFEIVVRAPRIQKQVVSTEVLATQARMVPGTSGDVLKVVENLPGVARSAAGSGALVVWGAAPEDTRVYLDGVRIPRLYHEGGYRSIISSDLVRSVELIPGGYGPMYGRGLGGIVSVDLTNMDDEGVHGSAGADAIDGSASVRTNLGDNLHIALAGRKSWLDREVPAFTSSNVAAFIPIPRYDDAQGRIVYKASETETVEVSGLLSSDRISNALERNNPALTTSQEKGIDFNRVWMRYQDKESDGTVVSVVPFFGTDSESLLYYFGNIPTDVVIDSRVYGLRAYWRSPLSPEVTVEVGVDGDLLTSSISRSGSIGSPSREGDTHASTAPPPSQINFDGWQTTVGSFAPYAQTDLAFFESKLHVIPGLRVDPIFDIASAEAPPAPGNPPLDTQASTVVIEPRVSARYSASDKLSFKAAFGIYHQPPLPEDLSAIFGTPDLGLSVAHHYLVGAKYAFTDLLNAEVTAFVSNSENLVARNQAASPAVAASLVNAGLGRSYGGQLLLRQDKIGPFFGWISYSLVKSERRDAPGLPWRPFDYDQTHVFTALGSFDMGNGIQIGGRLRFASGFPRTAVVGSYWDSRAGLYQPIYSTTVNGTRIPPFVSFDLRFSKTFKVSPGNELETYLDLQNVTNHANDEEVVYNPDFTQKSYIVGLPILPVVGARWSF